MSLDSRKKPPMAHQKSARQNVSSSHGKTSEVPHIVRVTVLGLTGLTMNKNRSGDTEANDENRRPKTNPNASNRGVDCSENKRKIKPPKKSKIKTIAPKVPNPDELRAFVSLSRSSTVVGTSNLSHPFHRLHEHDVVGANSEASDEFEVPNMLDVERYAAIWPSTNNACVEDVKDKDDDALSILMEDTNSKEASTAINTGEGTNILNDDKDLPSNVISFETKLCRRCVSKKGCPNENSESTHGGKSLYEYAPKSFEIIVSLAVTTNDNDGSDVVVHEKEMESSFGLPLGVATLALNAQQQELELPVLSLSQARPMIAVGEVSMPCMEQNQEHLNSTPLNLGMKESIIQTNSKIANIEGSARKGNKKQKRRIRWGIFGSKKRDPTKEEITRLGSKGYCPTDQEIATLNMKYSIGSSCKAALQLKVEIFEKLLDRDKSSKELRHYRRESSRKGKFTSVDKKHLKAFYELNRSITPDIALIDVSDSEGDLSDYLSDASENSDEISENTGASWDTVSTMSTQGTRGTTFTTASWNSCSTGSTLGASSGTVSYTGKNDSNGKDQNGTSTSMRPDQNEDSDDNEGALSNNEDEEESIDDSHVTLHFRGEKIRVSTPNPIHVACQGSHNTTWLAEKSSAMGKICNEKIWNWKYDSEVPDKCNSAESPHGVHEFDERSIHNQSLIDKIPKALTFSERQVSLKQTVIDAISCQGSSRVCQQKYHTDPIEVAILSTRSMVSLDCDDVRELREEGALIRHQGLKGAEGSSCKNGKLSA